MTAGLRAARVYQGIAVMDIHHGEQWVWGVDPDTLNVNFPRRCVIGQVAGCAGFEDYERELDRMDIGTQSAQSNAGFFPLCHAEIATLDRVWAYAIRRLREQRPQEVAA